MYVCGFIIIIFCPLEERKLMAYICNTNGIADTLPPLRDSSVPHQLWKNGHFWSHSRARLSDCHHLSAISYS